MVLQILFAASVSCQFHEQQSFPSHYQIQKSHQQPHEPQSYHHQSNLLGQEYEPSSNPFDFDKFNQQAKQIHAQVKYFNEQQQKHIQSQINSVHQDGSEPHFDFAVNGNYTDLEKASEQFVNLGRLVGKQNMPPKVIKITKTVAVKQPVPVPYPVPVVKVVKEQSGFNEYSGHGQQSHQQNSGKSLEPSKYFNSHPTEATSQSENFYQNSRQQTAPLASEYDTEPFYITTPQKETIKIIPVPYYVDEHGNKHEVSPSNVNSSPSREPETEAFYPTRQGSQPSREPETFYPTRQASQSSPSREPERETFYPTRQASQSFKEPAKSFQSITFSYHPPTHSTPKPQHHEYQQHYPQYHQQITHHSQPSQPQFTHQYPDSLGAAEQPNFYYNEDSSSASSDPEINYQSTKCRGIAEDQTEPEEHYQYKYVYEK